ncbi:MAG: hypothetical protein ONB23_01560 [candidate division KSB1 bacterium]|nr:hypothetical protein [candidate division KSB1 bacterium]
MSKWMAVYNVVVVPLLYVGLHLLALANGKVRRGIAGRKGLFSRLEEYVAHHKGEPRLWIHVSSLGEFEQAKPIAALAKERWPHLNVVVTFFSPSGYEHAGSPKGVDFISYLPFDCPRNAYRFISLLRPSVGIVIRHDIWPNHVAALRKQGIPVLLVDASLRPLSRPGRSWQRAFDRFLFQPFTLICAVSEDQERRIRELVPNTPTRTCGDTRYDQVVRRAQELDRIRDLLARLPADNRRTVVLGSTWPSDENVILPALVACMRRLGARAIVCPHEPSANRVGEIRAYFRDQKFVCQTLSEWRQAPSENWDALVVDSVGLLANLYALGHIAYVGGSFGPGVHSVLEPAAHALPVVVGPRYQNSPDACLLVERGAAFVVRHTQEAEEAFLRLLSDEKVRQEASAAALRVVQTHTGASEKIIEIVAEFLEERS